MSDKTKCALCGEKLDEWNTCPECDETILQDALRAEIKRNALLRARLETALEMLKECEEDCCDDCRS